MQKFKNPSLTPARIAATASVVALWASPILWAWWQGWSVGQLESLSKVLGILGTASFFAYKAVVGFFIMNASLTVAVRRARAEKDSDFLAVTVSLAKGDRGALVMHDLKIRVSPEGGTPIDRTVETARRLSYNSFPVPTDTSRAIERLDVALDVPSGSSPFLHLSPGEAAQFSTFVRVPQGVPCLVEAVLIGRKPSDRPVGQWRSSVVSLPADRIPEVAG